MVARLYQVFQMLQRQFPGSSFEHKSLSCLKAPLPISPLRLLLLHTHTPHHCQNKYTPLQPHLQCALHLVHLDDLEKIPFRHTLIPINLLASASTHKPLTLKSNSKLPWSSLHHPATTSSHTGPFSSLQRKWILVQLNKHSTHAFRRLGSTFFFFSYFCLHARLPLLM